MNESKENVLMKNNIIVKSKYNLNMVENRIFQMILFNLQKQNSNTMIAEIGLEQFRELIKKKNDKTVEAISNMLEELRKGSLEIKTHTQWLRYGFINGATYDKERQHFIIKADSDIYRLLFDYLQGYTPVNLEIFFSFKSFYSQRLYEFLRLWSNTKTVINYSIDELRELLMLNDKYTLYKDFKRRVIAPAIKELNEKSLMNVEFKENKTGKKVTSIDFIVTDNDKRKYFEGNKESKPIHQEQQQKKTYGKNKTLKFVENCPSREYDYNDLEKKLLGWED